MDYDDVIRRNAARGLREARHDINTIAREALAMAEGRAQHSRIAADLAQALNAALLEYELGLAEVGRHRFFDGRRNKQLRAAPSIHPMQGGTREALHEIAGRLEAIVLNGRLLDRLMNGCGPESVDERFYRQVALGLVDLQAALHDLPES